MTVTVEPPRVEAPDAGVIEEARARQRRHRRMAAAATLAAVAIAAIPLLFAGGGGRPRPGHASLFARRPPSKVPAFSPSTVLTERPWVGSACPGSGQHLDGSGRTLCDRVGLAITLRTPAVAATATINGQSFKLDSVAWSDPPVAGKHKSLSGFLKPAAFLTRGPFKIITDRAGYRTRITIEYVHLVIDYGAGREVQTSLTELGYGGWG